MRSSRALLLFALILTTSACGGGGGGGAPVVPVATATLTSISVTPLNWSMSTNQDQQFAATGTYSNGTKKDVTGTVAWSSSDTLVATVSTTGGTIGTVSSLATGTTLISASTGSVTGSTVLKVTSGGAVAPAANVLPVSVNANMNDSPPNLCSWATSSAYPNKPCVQVTICTRGSTTSCQTIKDILLDTGSFGLRLFGSVLTIPLNQVPAGAGALAECIQYADGSTQWGPVQLADVWLSGLAGEPAVTVPVQVIDQGFAKPSQACSGPLAQVHPTDASAGFNGILGLGLFQEDCGPICVNASVGLYYSCSQSGGIWTCTPTTVALADQVQNPVASLPVDNNGVIVSLPGVPADGTAATSGSLILGIGTETNNQPWAVTTYPANGAGDFTTIFNGVKYDQLGFIDSGSNAIYFPSTIATCLGGWYCPSSLKALTATNTGYAGSPSVALSFFIGNAGSLFKSGNLVFNDLGGSAAGMFDWGLPFFLGRDVYVGIDGQHSSSLNATGPYWAY